MKKLLFLFIAMLGLSYPCDAQFYDNDDEVVFYYRRSGSLGLSVYAFNFAGDKAAVLTNSGFPHSHSLFNLNNTLIEDNLYFEKLIFKIDKDCIIKYK